jgi:DNA-binding NarL/FixJ family response regulator
LPNKAIAQSSSVTPKAIEHHVQHIYDKLGVATHAEATLFAAQHDLVHHDPVGPGSSATSGRPFVAR